MRTLTAISLLVFLALASDSKAGDTNEFLVTRHQTIRGIYEWRISEARITATPQWRMGTKNIPVSPDKARQLAWDWWSKRGQYDPKFIGMEIRPFGRGDKINAYRERFFYRIDYAGMPFGSMPVIVLMDGTVVEPQPFLGMPPDKQEAQTKMNLASKQQAEVTDARLAAIEKKFEERLHDSQRTEFAAAMKRWRSYRDSEVAFRADCFGHGSTRALMETEAYWRITRDRVCELEALFTDPLGRTAEP